MNGSLDWQVTEVISLFPSNSSNVLGLGEYRLRNRFTVARIDKEDTFLIPTISIEDIVKAAKEGRSRHIQQNEVEDDETAEK